MILELTRVFVWMVHVLAAAAWFGAMFYSLTVLHPRARAFFATPAKLEEFIAFIAAGARWKVLFGCAVIAVTGVLLALLHEGAGSPWWRACLGAKTLLLAGAVALFVYISWVVWPARVMAPSREIPAFQRRFRWFALCLLLLVTLCFLLSVLAHLSIS